MALEPSDSLNAGSTTSSVPRAKPTGSEAITSVRRPGDARGPSPNAVVPSAARSGAGWPRSPASISAVPPSTQRRGHGQGVLRPHQSHEGGGDERPGDEDQLDQHRVQRVGAGHEPGLLAKQIGPARAQDRRQRRQGGAGEGADEGQDGHGRRRRRPAPTPAPGRRHGRAPSAATHPRRGGRPAAPGTARRRRSPAPGRRRRSPRRRTSPARPGRRAGSQGR